MKSTSQPNDFDLDRMLDSRVHSLLAGIRRELECPAQEDSITRAARIIQKLRSSTNPAIQVDQHLDELDELLPALVDLHLRQAVAGGQIALVQELQVLKCRLQNADVAAPSRPVENVQAAGFSGQIMLFSPAQQESARINQLYEILYTNRYPILCGADWPAGMQGEPPALAIFSNPHLQPAVLEQMALLSARGTPILVDLDRDFENLPVSHPDYTNLGLQDPTRARAYTTALLLASRVTVPSQALAESLHSAGYAASVVPDSWSKANPLWQQPVPRRSHLHIGISGLFGQVEDVTEIRRIVLRVMREFPNTRLVVLDSPEIYHFFNHLEEERRIFLPAMKCETRPTMLKQIDLLLVPLRNHPYNQAISDRVLLEAAVCKTPWVASPAAAFAAWDGCGRTASTPEEWHTTLRELLLNPDLRVELGQAGALRAQQRELQVVGRQWLTILEETARKQPSPQAD